MLKFLSIFVFTLLTAIPNYASIIVPADVVEGQDSERNFVGKKGHFEKTSNGVNGYDDGSAAVPVDGNGGTVTTTCTRSTSSPLDGDGSLIITKDAADRRGEGCSLDFTIPTAMKAKVLQIEFDYIVSSGTFSAGSSSANSDIIAYIYDVSNSTLIEPSSIKLLTSSTSIPDRFVANFQTSATGTSYRLMFHVSTTSSSAYVLKIDNIKVKPSRYVYGTPITDWLAYTPAGTWSSNTTWTGFWRRVGQDMEVKFQASLSGAPSGNFTVNIPSGYAIDTTKLLSTSTQEEIGFARINDSGSAVYHVGLRYNSTVSVLGINLGVSGTYLNEPSAIDATTPITFGSGDYVNGFFKVPIVGWSSSVQVSDGYDGRLIVANAYRSSTSQNINSASDVKIQWNGETKDTTSSFDSTTNYRFTVPSQGPYQHSGIIGLAASSSNIATLYLYKNGSQHRYLGSVITSASVSTSIPFSVEADANAGDYFELYLNTNSASQNVLSDAAAPGGSQWYISKLQAPTTISATEKISAAYQSSSGQTVTSSAIIVFGTKIIDTHNAYNSSTGIFTAPISGEYRISYKVFATGVTDISTQGFDTNIRKNSSNTFRGQGASVGVTNQIFSGQSAKVSLLAGETLDVYNVTAHAAGSLNANGMDNYIFIELVK